MNRIFSSSSIHSSYQYSKIHVTTFKGITYTTVYNACVEPNSYVLQMYQDPNDPDHVKTLKFGMLFSSLMNSIAHYYPWIQWKKTSSQPSSRPMNTQYIEDEGIWMMHTLNDFLLSNYVESVNFLVHHLYFPSTLPLVFLSSLWLSSRSRKCSF